MTKNAGSDRDKVFRIMAACSSDCLMWFVNENKIAYVSPAARTITGYDPEVFLSDPDQFIGLVHPGDRGKIMEALASGFKDTKAHELNFRMTRKDGQTRWIDFFSQPVHGEKGELIGRVVRLKDVTDKVLAEMKVKEKEHFLQDFFDGFQDPVNIIDENYRVILTNKKLLELKGLSWEEIKGKPCYEIFEGEDAACEEGEIREVFRTRRPQVMTRRLYRPDGTYRQLEIFAYPLFGEDGRVTQVVEISRDITDLERAIRDRLRMTRIVEQASEAVTITDLKGNIEYVNAAFEKMAGYTLEEIVGKNPRILKSGRHSPEFYKEIWRTIRKGGVWRGIFINRRKNGQEYYEDAAIFPIRDNSGKIINYGKIAKDITDLKKAEDALREQERLLRTLMNSTPDLICFKDAQGRWIEANKTALQLFSLEGGGYRGKTDAELSTMVNPIFRRVLRAGAESDQVAWESGKISRREEIIPQPDGGERIYDIVKIPIFNPDGSKKVLIVLGRDITEYKMAEQALKESEARYRSIFEESQDGIYVSSSDGRIIDMNPAGIRLFGYDSLEEVQQKNIATDFYADPSDRERFIEQFQSNGFVKDYELVLKKKDGSKLNVLVSATSVRDADGNVLGYRGIMRDITEKKNLEAQLVQAQKMEAIGTLAGGIAHDFNNLLTVINGYAELAMLKLEASHPAYRSLASVLEAGEKAEALTSRLLAFSRKQIVKPKILDINHVIASMGKMLQRLIGEDIHILMRLGDGLAPVKADPSQIEQVVINLVVNARDALREVKKQGFEKKITIETGMACLGHEYVVKHPECEEGPYVFFSVSDNGIGMTQEIQERIFEPFFTTKEKNEGTGLGLSMVYGIVKQNRGNIYVYSEPNEGTTFKIYWPVSSTEKNVESERAPDVRVRGTERILVVEDDGRVLDFATDLLSLQGYEVYAAENGLKALKLLEEEKLKVDLILTDLVMPKMSGAELIKKIRSFDPDVKVIYTSGYTDNHIVHKELLKEGVNFIQKPYSVRTLSETVRKVLDEAFLTRPRT